MAHAEYLVLEDRADGTGDTIEVSVHKTADKAIEECDNLHKETGKYYEVEYLLVEGTKNRQILEVDGIYGIGEASWAQ
jgi:ketosteroid isomerase-like protein|tara:strand:+ start:200 stop:433 length:234 start_codon:yes stop_codon:yes gene_type:complete